MNKKKKKTMIVFKNLKELSEKIPEGFGGRVVIDDKQPYAVWFSIKFSLSDIFEMLEGSYKVFMRRDTAAITRHMEAER